MKQSVLVLGNSDSGLYDFRKEVLMALMQEGYEACVGAGYRVFGKNQKTGLYLS